MHTEKVPEGMRLKRSPNLVQGVCVCVCDHCLEEVSEFLKLNNFN